MLSMAFRDICRLCFSKNNLVWVFDKRFENSDSMRYVVLITTGVEINSTDAVSQKICETCCHITVNFFEFRKVSLNNDKLLKEKLKTVKDEIERETPSATFQVKQEPMDASHETPNDDTPLPIHPTIGELFDLHPHIKLPRICLKADVKPFVILPMDAVENYYKRRKLNFQEHCKLALKPRNTARKRTSLHKTKPTSTNPTSPCLINARIIPQRHEDGEKGLVQPIKLRIYPKSVPKENESESNQNTTEKTTPCHRKRKITDDESPTKENEKPEENCVSPEPQDVSKSLSYVANVSVPLQMCNICYAVHDNYKELRKHRLTHLRCQFCKAIFRSLETKNEHLESKCLIKNTINNFPIIEVSRIESNIDVVTKYSNVFSDHPSIQSGGVESSISVEPSSESEEDRKSPEPIKCASTENASDVIEIFSDDDETSNIKNNVAPVIPTKAQKLPPAITPDVKLKNNTAIGVISSNLIKELVLKNMLPNSALSSLSTDKEVQTEKLHERNIEVDSVDQTAVLAHLKQHLQVFRVPVRIKNGPFQVSYNVSVDEPRTKNLRFWNDMTPVDIKVNNTGTTVSNQCSGAMDVIKQTKSTTEVVPLTPTTQEQTSDSNNTNVPYENGTISSSCFDKPVNSTHNHISVVGLSTACTFPPRKNSVVPTTQEQTSDANNTNVPYENGTISNSCLDKPVNSTHNHISVVGLSTACTFPPRKNSVVPPTSTTEMASPTPTNVTADPSAFSVAPTSALAPVPAQQESTLPNPVFGSTTESSESHASTLSTNNILDDISVASTFNSVPVSIDLKHLNQHLHVFRVPVEIQNGLFQVTYHVSLDEPKTKNLRLWNDMTPVDIKGNNTGTTVLAQCINRSNDTMAAMEQTGLTTEAVVTSGNDLISSTAAQSSVADDTSKVLQQKNAISNSGSCFDKPVDSIRNHISIQDLLASSTVPSRSNNSVSTTASRSITADPSFSIALTSVLSSVAVTQESTSLDCAHGPTAGSLESHNNNLNNDGNSFVSFPIASNSAIVSVPIEQSSTQPIYSSVDVSTAIHTSTFSMENNSAINAAGPNSTERVYISTEVSSANGTTNSQPIDMSLNQPHSVATSSYSTPVNIPTVVSKPLISSKNPYKPIRFRVPSLYKTKSHSGVSPLNIFNNTRNHTATSHFEDMLSTSTALVKETQLQRSSTSFSTKDNQHPSLVNSAPPYMISNVSRYGKGTTYWPTKCPSAPPPTNYSVGYSNVPTMAVNSEGSCVPESSFTPGPPLASRPTPVVRSNTYFPTTFLTSEKSSPLAAKFNGRRNSAPHSVNSASTYMNQANHTQLPQVKSNDAMQTAMTTCEGLRMSTKPSQSSYYNSPNVRETADVLVMNSSTYSLPNSVHIPPSVTECSTPVGNAQHGQIRVRNMKELT